MHQVMPPKGNLLWVKVSEERTQQDDDALIPASEKMLAQQGYFRRLFEMEPGLTGWETGATWKDAKFTFARGDRFERVAMAGEIKWEEWEARAGALLVDARVNFSTRRNGKTRADG